MTAVKTENRRRYPRVERQASLLVTKLQYPMTNLEAKPAVTKNLAENGLCFTAPDLMKPPVPVWHKRWWIKAIRKSMPSKADGANGFDQNFPLKTNSIDRKQNFKIWIDMLIGKPSSDPKLGFSCSCDHTNLSLLTPTATQFQIFLLLIPICDK